MLHNLEGLILRALIKNLRCSEKKWISNYVLLHKKSIINSSEDFKWPVYMLTGNILKSPYVAQSSDGGIFSTAKYLFRARENQWKLGVYI